MTDKIFILDTNVLFHDPEAPRRFGDLRFVIPMQVVVAIDRFKKDHSEKGRNARRISRLLIPIDPAEALPVVFPSSALITVC